jgi:hypothetical protein
MPGYPAYLAVIQAFPGTHLILELSRYADLIGTYDSPKRFEPHLEPFSAK